MIKFVFSGNIASLYMTECDIETGLDNAICVLDSTQPNYTFYISKFDSYDIANTIKINLHINNPAAASTLSDLKITSYYRAASYPNQ